MRSPQYCVIAFAYKFLFISVFLLKYYEKSIQRRESGDIYFAVKLNLFIVINKCKSVRKIILKLNFTN